VPHHTRDDGLKEGGTLVRERFTRSRRRALIKRNLRIVNKSAGKERIRSASNFRERKLNSVVGKSQFGRGAWGVELEFGTEGGKRGWRGGGIHDYNKTYPRTLQILKGV